MVVSKHVFSKSTLILPLHYYRTLITRLGPNLTRLHLDLPESADSPAMVDYQQLLNLPYLISFSIRRGERQYSNIIKKKVLETHNLEAEERRQLVIKKALVRKASWVKAIKNLSNPNNKPAIRAVLMFLL